MTENDSIVELRSRVESLERVLRSLCDRQDALDLTAVPELRRVATFVGRWGGRPPPVVRVSPTPGESTASTGYA